MSTEQWAVVGNRLGPLEIEPISRHTLALYCGASADHNPIHVDIEAARAAGHADVIAHGMLSMAYLGRLLCAYVRFDAIESFSARFLAITHVGDRLLCEGEVTAIEPGAAGTRVFVDLLARTGGGRQTISGKAILRAGAGVAEAR